MNIHWILAKHLDRRITVLTCYDFPTARALDTSEVDIVFVGNSVGTDVLGHESERDVTLDEIVHHLKAVRRGITRKILMADFPYQALSTPEIGVRNAAILNAAGADIVKLEGGSEIAPVVAAIVGTGAVVMGHLGFQPRIAGEAKRTVVGAQAVDATRLYEGAVSLEQAGVCGIVLECVPEAVAKVLSDQLSVPTIGIGSGRYTDGQLLAIAHVLGWFNMPYRFVKRYEEFYERTVHAANCFCEEVRSGEYPKFNHGFRIKAEQFEAFSLAIDHVTTCEHKYRSDSVDQTS